jgi:hypothetical protein
MSHSQPMGVARRQWWSYDFESRTKFKNRVEQKKIIFVFIFYLHERSKCQQLDKVLKFRIHEHS